MTRCGQQSICSYNCSYQRWWHLRWHSISLQFLQLACVGASNQRPTGAAGALVRPALNIEHVARVQKPQFGRGAVGALHGGAQLRDFAQDDVGFRRFGVRDEDGVAAPGCDVGQFLGQRMGR